MGVSWSNEKYQFRLEVASVAIMTVLMLLFALTFLVAPDRFIFARFRLIDLHLTPELFAAGCLVGMLVYPLLLLPPVRRWAREIRQEIFMLGSVPILLYLLLAGYDQLQRQITATPLVYIGIYGLILMHSFALYHGYRRWLERLSAVVMACLLTFLALTFALNPASTLFGRLNAATGWHIVPMSFALLSSLAGVGYLLSLALARWHPLLRRLLFALLELPLLLYGGVLLFNALSPASARLLIGALALLALYLLVALLGGALYRNPPTITRRAGHVASG